MGLFATDDAGFCGKLTCLARGNIGILGRAAFAMVANPAGRNRQHGKVG